MQVNTEEERDKSAEKRYKSGNVDVAVYIGCHRRREIAHHQHNGGKTTLYRRATDASRQNLLDLKK